MAASRRGMLSLLLVAGAMAITAGGCVIEREFDEEDAVDAAAPRPVPLYGRPVTVVASYPPDGARDVPLDTPLWFEVDQYLESDALSSTGTLLVQSGGIFASVQVHYEMVGRRLVGTLRAPLQPDFEYILTLDPQRVRGIDGAPLLEVPVVRFRTGQWTLEPSTVEPRRPGFALDIAPIFARGCGCHTIDPVPEPWFELPALSWSRLVGQVSQSEPSLLLVEPGDPTHSVLMRRLLPDFPRSHRVSMMPPPWADDVARTRDLAHAAPSRAELERIEDWIQSGAAP